MIKKVDKKLNRFLENISLSAPQWIGTSYSIVLHTMLFAGVFILGIFEVSTDKILLILTTTVSLEAIYLAIFIQMTVNRQGQNIEDIQEDVEDISEDVEDIQEEDGTLTLQTLKNIEIELQRIQKDLALLQKKGLL